VTADVRRHPVGTSPSGEELAMFAWLAWLMRWLRGLFKSLSPATRKKIIEVVLAILQELFRRYYRANAKA
jgi:hypothetical protein